MTGHEYAIYSSNGEHLWPLSNVEDLPVYTTKAECVRALAGYDPDFWDGDEVIVSSPVRQWTVSMSAMEDLKATTETANYLDKEGK